MDSKNVVDLSPKIFSVLCIITILIHVITGIVYVGRIDHKAITPAIILLIFFEYNSEKSIPKRNN